MKWLRPAVAGLARLITGVRQLRRAPCGEEPAIYFANHTSHLDFAVVWAALPGSAREMLSPAAAEDYWGKSAFRLKVACGLFQAVLIPREGITRENHPIERLAAVLKAGRSVLIFPEGTRRSDGRVGEFKAGLHHLARRFPELPLVPVQLENLSRVLPKGAFLPVPIIGQARFREPIRFDREEPKALFLARARLALLGGVEETESEE
jgi:1-acyl-sn-glycerol-3-phosphate acyltransferase